LNQFIIGNPYKVLPIIIFSYHIKKVSDQSLSDRSPAMLKAAGSGKKNTTKDIRKKSRVSTNLNSAPNQRALKFTSNNASLAWLADEQPVKTKIQKLKDSEENLLQINPQHRYLNMIDLAEETIKYGPKIRYYQSQFEAQSTKGNVVAGQLKGNPDSMMSPMMYEFGVPLDFKDPTLRKLESEVDTGMVYKDDIKDLIKQSISVQHHVHKANVQVVAQRKKSLKNQMKFSRIIR